MTPTLLLKTSTHHTAPESILGLLVSLDCPELGKAAPRPNLNVALVLDASGSMSGRPLMEAKSATIHFIHQLTAEDRVSVVAYGDTSRVVLEPMNGVQAQAQIRGALASVENMGMTALHEGWLQGARQVAPGVGKYSVNRVMVLSDGNANVGERNTATLKTEAVRLYEAGISTSTYGLGMNFNEDLMTGIAVGGQACYAESADALTPYFDTEFQMMSRLVGIQAQVKITLPDGVVGDFLSYTPDQDGWISVGNLTAGGSSWMVFEVPGQGRDLAIEVQARWRSQDGMHHTQATTVVPTGVPGDTDEAVVERIKEVRAAAQQAEARRLALEGERHQAAEILRQMQATAGDNAYIVGVAETLSGMLSANNMAGFAKESAYASSTMTTRTVWKGETTQSVGSHRLDARKLRQGKV